MSQAIDMPLTYTRDELRERLMGLRAKAEKVDERNLVKHQKAEARYLAEFQKACTKAAKWDYEQAKEHSFDPRTLMAKAPEDKRWRSYPQSPSCPRSEVSVIDSFIDMLDRTTQPRFTLSRNGKWHALFDLLTTDVRRAKGLC